jgi:hypothetical protein
MFSTGKIGLWSVIEEGIGIIAGSLPALRPLLSIPFLGRSTTATSSGPSPGSQFKQSRSRNQGSRSGVKMDTFQQLGDRDAEGDGDSQRHIIS